MLHAVSQRIGCVWKPGLIKFSHTHIYIYIYIYIYIREREREREREIIQRDLTPINNKSGVSSVLDKYKV